MDEALGFYMSSYLTEGVGQLRRSNNEWWNCGGQRLATSTNSGVKEANSQVCLKQCYVIGVI